MCVEEEAGEGAPRRRRARSTWRIRQGGRAICVEEKAGEGARIRASWRGWKESGGRED